MTDEINGGPTSNFWIIGAVALVWNLIGLFLYYNHVTLSPEALAEVTDSQREFLTAAPTWATSAYAIAVTAGVLGSVLLLMRKAWAVPVFILSLAGVVVQQFHAFVLANAIEVWGTSGLYVPIIVLVVAIALVWYSQKAKAKGWIA